jgi:lipoprotein-releasing system ATP-binding protein
MKYQLILKQKYVFIRRFSVFIVNFVSINSSKMIQATNIHKSFDTLEVLKGVDLQVSKGEIVSIVGPSGAGKTTLLQILGTLDKPNKGIVKVDGVDLSKMNDSEQAAFRNKRIGFIFQFHQLLPEFTALENVMIPALIANQDWKKIKHKAKELLNYLQLGERLEHKPSELSGGEKQRVAVARALINDPKIILADEPSGSLDSKNKEDLHKLLFDLRDKFGLTIVIVTHDKELAALSDRKIEMRDGLIKG